MKRPPFRFLFVVMFAMAFMSGNAMLSIAQAEHAFPCVADDTAHVHDGTGHTHADQESDKTNQRHQHFPGDPEHSHSEGHLPGMVSLSVLHPVPVNMEAVSCERIRFLATAHSGLPVPYLDTLYRPPIS